MQGECTVNDNLASKQTAIRRYAVPFVAGALVLGVLAVLTASFGRSADASTASTPASAPVALQAAALPTPTPAQVAINRSAPILGRVTGNLTSANQASLTFQLPGRIRQYMVKEGDKVKQGDVLASLDTTTLELQVTQAQAALKLAQAHLSQTVKGGTPDQVAATNQALALAKANYAKVLAGPTRDDLSGPKAALDKATAALQAAQAAYDLVAWRPSSQTLTQQAALAAATADYQAALGAYNNALNQPTPAEIASAAAQLAQEYSLAAQVNPTDDTITIAQAQVDQAQAALDLAKQNLANARIVAPFDGTVVWIGPHVGETANTQSTANVLADLSQMQVQANVDAPTLAGLKVGQRATLSVDALGGKPLTGHVSKIGLLGTTAGSIISVPIWIDVDQTNAPIFPGLATTVQFESAQ
jgi:HlyD family secretion protein